MRRPAPLLLALLIATTLAAPATAGERGTSGHGDDSPAADPFPPVPKNPADRLVRRPIEPPSYDHSKRCRRKPQPGTRALERWLQKRWTGTSWGIMRCEKLGSDNYSLHADGRALDWHLDASRRAERREADRLVELFLATDRAGNRHALARRMGIQEIIWNCRAWFSGADRLRKYSACYDRRGRRRKRLNRTIAHRDHLHIGLNRDGARGQTSYWRALRSAERARAKRRAERRAKRR